MDISRSEGKAITAVWTIVEGGPKSLWPKHTLPMNICNCTLLLVSSLFEWSNAYACYVCMYIRMNAYIYALTYVVHLGHVCLCTCIGKVECPNANHRFFLSLGTKVGDI
jgi:hypothetical protein